MTIKKVIDLIAITVSWAALAAVFIFISAFVYSILEVLYIARFDVYNYVTTSIGFRYLMGAAFVVLCIKRSITISIEKDKE